MIPCFHTAILHGISYLASSAYFENRFKFLNSHFLFDWFDSSNYLRMIFNGENKRETDFAPIVLIGKTLF